MEIIYFSLTVKSRKLQEIIMPAILAFFAKLPCMHLHFLWHFAQNYSFMKIRKNRVF